MQNVSIDVVISSSSSSGGHFEMKYWLMEETPLLDKIYAGCGYHEIQCDEWCKLYFQIVDFVNQWWWKWFFVLGRDAIELRKTKV